MKKNIKPKPCPNCGNDDIKTHDCLQTCMLEQRVRLCGVMMYCPNCYIRTELFDYDQKNRVVYAWNLGVLYEYEHEKDN
jgi:hypothetical protein